MKPNLTYRIVIGMIAGILLGAILRQFIAEDSFLPADSRNYIKVFFVDFLFHVVGTIFIASLKMLVVPLVFVSLVCGTCNLSDPSKLGRLGGKAISLYLLTTAIAISIAISFALIIAPGQGLNLSTDATFAAKESPGLAQVIINMFPNNPVNAMAEGNMLQIIVFSLLFGVAMALSGDAGKRLAKGFNDANEVIMKLVAILMNLAPYGVFALMAKLFSTIELSTFAGVAKYFVLLFCTLVFHAITVYPILLKTFTGLNPLIFLRKMRDTAIFAFSTSSSNATIPVTLETVTKKMGASNNVASFTVPLGATINMDGTAIMQGVATVFIAQVYGVDLSVSDFLMVILTATLASVGTAGVPGVGLIMLAMVLQQVNLPVEGIALIIGVDRLLDMTRTVVNVTGDSMVTCVVSKSEGELDTATFNDIHAARTDETVDMTALGNKDATDSKSHPEKLS